ATATIVPGTIDTGNHCDDCVTYYTLPFSVRLYDRTFNHAFLSSNGNVQFASSAGTGSNACLPIPVFEYAIIPYWDDLLTDQTGKGIFASVTGSAPNRVLNLEWRACNWSSTGCVAGSDSNFEVRLFE